MATSFRKNPKEIEGADKEGGASNEMDERLKARAMTGQGERGGKDSAEAIEKKGKGKGAPSPCAVSPEDNCRGNGKEGLCRTASRHFKGDVIHCVVERIDL